MAAPRKEDIPSPRRIELGSAHNVTQEAIDRAIAAVRIRRGLERLPARETQGRRTFRVVSPWCIKDLLAEDTLPEIKGECACPGCNPTLYKEVWDLGRDP